MQQSLFSSSPDPTQYHYKAMFNYSREFTQSKRFHPKKHWLSSGIYVSVKYDEVIIDMPFPYTDGFFYKKYRNKLFLSNDLRNLIFRWKKINQIYKNKSPLNNNGYQIAECTNRNLLKDAILFLQKGKFLTNQTYNFLWAITFFNAWLIQSQERQNRDKGYI